MKLNKRNWSRIGVGAGFVFLACVGLSVWGKRDYCRGWANHYAARARQIRAEVEKADLTSEQRREHLMAADWHEIIARKYATVVREPWRPYPSRPLITLEERQMVSGAH